MAGGAQLVAALGGATVLPDQRPVNRLELAYDNARSTLAITRLTEAEVQGVAPLGAQLSVNGSTVSLDAKGRFAAKVSGRVLVFRLLGTEVFPAVREMAKEFDLKSPFETKQPVSLQFAQGAAGQVKAAAE